MLVPFVIDADSLIPDPSWTPAIARSCHYDLLEVWERIGLLVHDGEQFESSNLARAVERLPQNLKLLWQAMLKRSPPVPCPNDWGGSVTSGAVSDICAVASAALVDDTRAEAEFGLTEGQDEIALAESGAHSLAICRLIAANHARVFKHAIETSVGHIEVGESYQAIWNLRFRPLAYAPLKNISIVDRYAVEQHFRCPRQWLSGLERFLRLLDDDAIGVRYVSLFSAWTPKLKAKSLVDIESELSAVLQRLQKKSIKRLKVHMIPDSVFRTDARDRFVRFGHYVWDLGHGLDVFEGPTAAKRCSASFKTDAATYERVEKDLERNIKPCDLLILR
ncbi:hypothetical protein [uncultured Thiodictyon sp.]|uniref:hypothetical protein n=1 Tax=uncultured Thiodictyon sp. TaxID=1846217 RepID=UPI0025FE71FA|nr:hypothetical protein [uncultured Thiodictyon sp.]